MQMISHYKTNAQMGQTIATSMRIARIPQDLTSATVTREFEGPPCKGYSILIDETFNN